MVAEPFLKFREFLTLVAISREFIRLGARFKIVQHVHQREKKIENLAVDWRDGQNKPILAKVAAVVFRVEETNRFVRVDRKSKHHQKKAVHSFSIDIACALRFTYLFLQFAIDIEKQAVQGLLDDLRVEFCQRLQFLSSVTVELSRASEGGNS